jgi:ribosomal protein L7/L12
MDLYELNSLMTTIENGWSTYDVDNAKVRIRTLLHSVQNESRTAQMPDGEFGTGSKIAAIKWLRSATGLGLKEAKDACENIWRVIKPDYTHDYNPLNDESRVDRLKEQLQRYQDDNAEMRREYAIANQERNDAQMQLTCALSAEIQAQATVSAQRTEIAVLQGKIEMLMLVMGVKDATHDETLIELGREMGKADQDDSIPLSLDQMLESLDRWDTEENDDYYERYLDR